MILYNESGGLLEKLTDLTVDPALGSTMLQGLKRIVEVGGKEVNCKSVIHQKLDYNGEIERFAACHISISI